MHENIARINRIVTAVDMETPEFLGAVSPPIFDTSVFMDGSFDVQEQMAMGKLKKYSYARTSGNPTGDHLNRMLAEMENAEQAMTVSSGATAIYLAMVSCLKAGDHIVMDKNAYGRALGFARDEFPRFGITYTLVDMKDLQAVEAAIRPETSLMFLESPTSWLFEVHDIRAICAMAKARGIRTIIDNTYSTPVFQNPIDYGVDIVVHSATKYLSGHSNCMAGVIAASREFFAGITKVEAKLSAMECSKLMNSLRTFPLRMERHYESAKKVASLLEGHNKVVRVSYPGSPNHPQRELIEKQMYGASGTMSFILDCDREGTRRFFNGLRTIHIGGTWGTYESTIQTTDTNPNFQPNTEFTTLQPHQCRLSVGLENVDTMLEDLDTALRAI